MEKALVNGLLVVLMMAVVVGCATSGSGLSDEEKVRKQLDQWSQGLIEQDLDKFLATISEKFSARQAPDKETLAGFIQQADTLEELAKKLNMPADTFVETVKRYNEQCKKGVDEDFGAPGGFTYVPISVKEGWNTLIVKLINNRGDWFLRVLVADPEGNLEFQDAPPTP